jgi:hypothetical protein
MYVISEAFRTALTKSHRIKTRCDVVRNNNVLATLEVLTGFVRVDVNNDIWRRGTVRLTDPTGGLVPADAADLLAPYGNELKLYRGIAKEYLSGATADELVPLGVLRIADTTVYDSGDGLEIEINAYDRSRAVRRARFEDTYNILAGTNYAIAIQKLLTSRVPNLVFNFPSTTITAPSMTWDPGDDPWNAANRLATDLGWVIYFDQNGICTAAAVTDPTVSTPVWRYIEGEDAVFNYVSRRYNDEEVVNYWIVTGESTENAVPVRGVAYDDVPTSPTYVGSYGRVVATFTDKGIKTAAQAQSVAQAKLNLSRGASEELSLNTIVNPAHEPLDVVEVQRAKSRVNGRYILDALTIPLEAEQALPVECRRAS